MTLGWSPKSGVRVDHAQALDQPHDLVERAEMGPDGGQDGQAGLPGRGHARGHVQVGPELAGDHRAVGTERAMARDIEQVANPHRRHVGCHRLGRGGQFQLELGQAVFSSHESRPSGSVRVGPGVLPIKNTMEPN